MPDSNMRKAIREAHQLPNDVPIRDTNMANLVAFEAKDRNIRNLTGLERAMNLQWLTLGSNEIQDLSPLAGLTRLKGLWKTYLVDFTMPGAQDWIVENVLAAAKTGL